MTQNFLPYYKVIASGHGCNRAIVSPGSGLGDQLSCLAWDEGFSQHAILAVVALQSHSSALEARGETVGK